MIALERLSPLERAAFLLHDVFGLPLSEVAGTLDRDPGAVRQLAVHARKHVQADSPNSSHERNARLHSPRSLAHQLPRQNMAGRLKG
jgi:DNA-directed RNA polymerase specialized sigma24 family protein